MKNSKKTFLFISAGFLVLFSTGCSINNNSGQFLNESLTNQEEEAKDLDLSGQSLEKLNMSIFERKNLESLNVSNNNLSGALPSQIGNLRNLKYLNASNNQFTGAPSELGQLTKLEILDLSNNELTGLPNELSNLVNLKQLNLSGNQYSEQDLNIIRQNLPNTEFILN